MKVVKTVLAIIGFLAVFYSIYYFAYSVGFEDGQTPTMQQINQENERYEAAADLLEISDKYEKLYNTCQEATTSLINEEYFDAAASRGKMDALEEEIQEILAKYESENKRL